MRLATKCEAKIPAGYTPPPPKPPGTLRLDLTEGLVDTSTVRRTLAGMKPNLWQRYPDSVELERLLCKLWALDDGSVLVTAGADEALDRVCRTFLKKGSAALTARPGFSMIRHWIERAGGHCVEFGWTRRGFPMNEVVRLLRRGCSMVIVATPNNPTGLVLEQEQLLQLADECLASGALLVLDAAYGEFADSDATAELARRPGVVVVRTFSKAWALAGWRVGYCLARPELIARMRAVGAPYPVAAPALKVAEQRVLRDGEVVKQYVARVRKNRRRLSSLLENLGAKPWPSQANFVFCRFPRPLFVTRALESLGVSVRYMPGKTGWKGHARITVPADDGDFDMLEGALAKVLKPRALLFDLDGVLADVSGSYLKAIVECAASFGVEVNPAEVAREKSKPGTNNDWELTRRLLARRGVTVGLAAVRERFEMFYQGNRERPGLWRNERLLWPKSRLKALRTRLPLGIVTGRPKADAWRFLDRFGLSELFGAVVCLEDAPAKPSPEPVMLALRQLDVERAWMVGDSPDDMDAARSAGVVPVGFARKGPGARLRAQALRRRGAAAVLSSPAELSALLDAVGIRS